MRVVREERRQDTAIWMDALQRKQDGKAPFSVEEWERLLGSYEVYR